MISRIRGTLLDRSGETVEVDTPSGVVYEVRVPTNVLSRLPAAGTEVELRTLQVVREDDVSLYGFLAAHERTLFMRLLGASGVGAKLALAMMSTYTAERLARALAERDITALTQVSGIGKKTAERIVLDLADKVKDLAGPGGSGTGGGDRTQAAIAALVALGYDFQKADAAVRAALAEDADPGSTDELIRRALRGA